MRRLQVPKKRVTTTIMSGLVSVSCGSISSASPVAVSPRLQVIYLPPRLPLYQRRIAPSMFCYGAFLEWYRAQLRDRLPKCYYFLGNDSLLPNASKSSSTTGSSESLPASDSESESSSSEPLSESASLETFRVRAQTSLLGRPPEQQVLGESRRQNGAGGHDCSWHAVCTIFSFSERAARLRAPACAARGTGRSCDEGSAKTGGRHSRD